MSERSIHAGMAALSICESLLLALNDHKVLPEREIVGVLSDAAAAHKNAAESGADRANHLGAARLIQNVIDGGNSVRRS
jgi:hypothetical protein